MQSFYFSTGMLAAVHAPKLPLKLTRFVYLSASWEVAMVDLIPDWHACRQVPQIRCRE